MKVVVVVKREEGVLVKREEGVLVWWMGMFLKRFSRVSLIIFMVLSEEVSECSFIIFAVSTHQPPNRSSNRKRRTGGKGVARE